MSGNRRKTAFVLSGGASLGAIQVGMIRALYERGIEPDLIVGTSVGALNGAFIASRPPTVRTARELERVWLEIDRGAVFPVNPLTGLLGFIGARDHLVSDNSLRALICRNLAVERLEQTVVPLHVVATDLESGKEARISEGDVVSAILASSAIPGVFPPVLREGRLLIDGGVTNNSPIAHAIELGAERIYVLPTGNACDLHEPPRGALAMLLHAISLIIMRRLLVEIELLGDQAELVVLPPPCPLSITPIDFSHAKELIERGYEGARAELERGGERTPALGAALVLHDHRGPASVLAAP